MHLHQNINTIFHEAEKKTLKFQILKAILSSNAGGIPVFGSMMTATKV